MLDLDNFKAVNDRLGHPAGDAALKGLAACLRRSVTSRDFVARLGGDEFALWLAATDREMAIARAKTILTLKDDIAPYSAGPDKPLGLSVGLAVFQPTTGEKRCCRSCSPAPTRRCMRSSATAKGRTPWHPMLRQARAAGSHRHERAEYRRHRLRRRQASGPRSQRADTPRPGCARRCAPGNSSTTWPKTKRPRCGGSSPPTTRPPIRPISFWPATAMKPWRAELAQKVARLLPDLPQDVRRTRPASGSSTCSRPWPRTKAVRVLDR